VNCLMMGMRGSLVLYCAGLMVWVDCCFPAREGREASVGGGGSLSLLSHLAPAAFARKRVQLLGIQLDLGFLFSPVRVDHGVDYVNPI
jgi:hypothetical protein